MRKRNGAVCSADRLRAEPFLPRRKLAPTEIRKRGIA
ncbi:hypothetical protein BJ956_003090 [Arthrobacter psychrochitiniphilus]|nr:hypothetical protein [Arthrobacter psychrochitiniphilus]